MSEKNEVTLDSLMKNNLKAQAQIDPTEITAEVERQVETLSPEERMRVDEIKQSLNMQDSQLLSIYGSNSQKNLAQFSDQILTEIRSKDVGEIGSLMSDLMLKVRDLDIANIDEGGFLSKIPFLNNAKRSVEKYLAKYDVMESQIDKIQASLESGRMELLKDIGTFDKLYEKNVEYFNELQLYIVAGEEKIAEMRGETLPKLYEQAKASGDSMAVQVVNDFNETINRFEKKIYDLKTSKTMAIQTAPQIKLIQNNDKLLVDKVTDAINNTIPLWKSQVVIALGMEKQGRVLEMQKEVSDTTNELLKRNSARLKQNTLEVTKESERSTIDIETLKKVNEDLITTIEESLEIQENAKKARAEAAIELEKIESDLQDALLKTIKF
ncbi:toxic anion resistance protein [Fundicoccus culcitae]|uniref:Toxic anion resistance protein n=1 Tax=Fundicoccus culcitae TaxID=2969821 RepID=A0ABY5P2L8_9LACT|nr:toxic anion resistance protein [Fundicoccus culcitae]UUX32952.1 toxic anion resistance protein [Fundicoccus culcitae]